jgi:hypothetical protein
MLDTGRSYFYIRLLLFGLYFINGIIVINKNSVVSDESEHLYYGLRVLNGRPDKIYNDDASTQPISAFNAIPRAVEQLLSPGLRKTDGGVSDAIHGRYITLLICAFIGLYVYKWSREMFGEKAGLFSLFLFTFCPNLQANIPLVGTDAYAVLFSLTSAYYFRKFVLYSGWRNFILFSIQTGIALTVKHSLFLLPMFFAAIALVVITNRKSWKTKFFLNTKRALGFLLIVLVIINIAFLFRGTGTPLNRYHFKSDTFKTMQNWKVVNQVPLPLPAPFVEGYDGVKYMVSMGSGHGEVSGRSYLLGEYFTGNSKWYYYSVVILFKTPLIVLMLVAAVIIAYLRKPLWCKSFFTIGFPMSMAFFFLLFISFTNTSQHGLRHLLMIYPLFYVCLGQVVTWRVSWKKWALPIVLLYSLITFYSYFPNLLSYTNELIWNKTNAYRVLASTNIDHGQGGYALEKFLAKHPQFTSPPPAPRAGNYIVGINEFLDLYQRKKHPWLNNFAPYDHVDHCYLLFRIAEKDLFDKKLK